MNSSFILFLPFALLTATFLTQDALTGWLATFADLAPAFGAVAAVGLVSFGLAVSALRVRRA